MMPENPNKEDVIINKQLGKRLSHEQEYLFEFDVLEKTREIKRRLLSRNSNGDVNLDSFPDVTLPV
jgi:hypothetical protein